MVLPGSGRWHDRGATDSDSVLLFVGLSGPAFVRAALEFARGLAFHYDPREPGIVPAATNRLLAKRYAFVAKVKEAQNVGIIIASLSLGELSIF